MKNKLTTQAYWETYYKNDYANKAHIIKVCSYYDKFWEQLFLESSNEQTIIEIGGFPGRYLAYLGSKYDLIPTCLDYNSDVKQIKDTFQTMEVEQYNIIQEDFTRYMPQHQYDYVLSNGFVEHFEDFDAILDLHIKYLKSKGKLFIMIPNMRGYIRFYKYLVDHNNLKIHNLKCMSLKVFQDFALRHKLDLTHLSYFGGFPYNVHQKLNMFQRFIYKGHHVLFKKILNKLVNKYPSPYFSSSIIAIFERD